MINFHLQEVLEARIAELEEALVRLQDRVNQVSTIFFFKFKFKPIYYIYVKIDHT